MRQSQGTEAPTYTEEEILGLDKAKYEVVGRGQSKLVPRLVRDLYAPQNHNLDGVNRFLALYGLNADRYDQNLNPKGVMHPDLQLQRTEERDSRFIGGRDALLVLLKVAPDVRKELFGAGERKIRTRKRGEKTIRFSSAFDVVLANVRMRQDQYPLYHRTMDANLDKLLSEIEQATGLSAEQLFNPGHIPPLYGNKRTRAFQEVITQYNLLVSGKYTRQQVARRTGAKIGVIDRMLIKSAKHTTHMFSDRAIEIARRKVLKV